MKMVMTMAMRTKMMVRMTPTTTAATRPGCKSTFDVDASGEGVEAAESERQFVTE